MPGRTVLGIPASALAALPACPACYPAYGAILSALGLGALANTTAQTVITGMLLAVALGSLAYRANSRRGYGPFGLGVVATGLVVFSKFLLGSDPLMYGAVGVLVVSGLWNVWPKPDAECETCVDAAASPKQG